MRQPALNPEHTPAPALPSVPLRSLLFQLQDIQLIIRSADTVSLAQTVHQHTLLVFTGGRGVLRTGEQPAITVNGDKCCLLPPGASYSTDNQEMTLYYYLLTFTAITAGEAPAPYINELLPDRKELIVHPFTRVIRLAEELLASHGSGDEIQYFRQQLRFQELLLLLFEHNYSTRQLPSPAQSVESTILYLQDHYMESITVKQLAELAHVSPWQYTPIFQKLTGKRPLDYLADLRIKHSKHYLLESSEPLREIARLVGFSDEYYFSRRFRQKTGVTPGQYAQAQQRKVTVRDWTGHEVEIPERPRRIVYHGETLGDVLALGVKPVGGDEAFARNTVYKHRIRNLANVGFPLDPQLTRLISPDLIIIANPDERIYRRVSGIAPTVTFDSFAPLEERMRILGGWLGKPNEAEAWLEAYHAKNAAMWQRLYTGVLQPGETASALVYDHGSHLFAMGMSGLSTALYAPGGLQPTAEIKAMLDQGLGFGEVDPAQLHSYAGDRVFMLVPEREDSREAMKQLLQSPLWSSLPAVQRGHVYMLDSAKWNSGDALTRERLLTLLPKLLGGQQGG
ncbi:helix-turn-helix domain-containing protein [Paenibacillus sp. MMS20-IR301]|uniref:helix-turn-helix domain-containing protein n=1 Tax=Paenibacillus sp. MMS20-IR301 TaxID=2895946 RepID=UPI0028F0EB4F|nr:helix-turn-helix domain-containing protein [Paenibacillus sp. MMS20-IR301]WNS41139.1 ABC transporter substrate-binding protein [Paenibacillus sp. MMS20-IR301]